MKRMCVCAYMIWAYVHCIVHLTFKAPHGLACARFHGESMTTCGKFPNAYHSGSISNKSKDLQQLVFFLGGGTIKLILTPQTIPNQLFSSQILSGQYQSDTLRRSQIMLRSYLSKRRKKIACSNRKKTSSEASSLI